MAKKKSSSRKSSKRMLMWFIFSFVLFVPILISLSSRGALLDFRNRAASVDCKENRVKQTCGNPDCTWTDGSAFSPYGVGGCTTTISFAELCKTNPSATSTSSWNECSFPPDVANACIKGSQKRVITACDGKARIESQACGDISVACAADRSLVNTAEKCVPGVGCWVKQNSFCVLAGEENSGYTCQSNGLFNTAAPVAAYVAPEKSKNSCESEGNCWFGSYCLKAGYIGKETGAAAANNRAFCCQQGKGFRQESNSAQSGDSCSVIPVATPATWVIATPPPAESACDEQGVNYCRIKNKACHKMNGLDECYLPQGPVPTRATAPNPTQEPVSIICRYIRQWNLPITCTF